MDSELGGEIFKREETMRGKETPLVLAVAARPCRYAGACRDGSTCAGYRDRQRSFQRS